ncbi:MAG: agmatinase [Candidatus Cloacimonadales bacterium]|nr:agmatinase [Candidatus Cloacimonadales bacterium]
MNFAAIPDDYAQLDKAKIVILPIPYDGTSTWMKGADKGPQGILEASAFLELYDIETDSEVFRQGIHIADPILEDSTPEAMVDAAQKAASIFIDKGKFLVSLGGEHSISIGVIKAHAEKYNNLTILQLDAHADLQDVYKGSRFNHGCVMARVLDLGLPIVQVGIRSMDISEKKNMKPERTFFAKDIVENNIWQEKLIPLLTENVYITLDLDVFDPAFIPSTGTPEPGGLDWWSVLKLLCLVVKHRNLVGFDVVELCPDHQNKAPDFLAAKLIYKVLSHRFLENE